MKRKAVLTLMMTLLALLAQQLTLAQDARIREIPITSVGFGAKLSPDGNTLVTFENINVLGIEEVDPSLLPMRVIDLGTGEERGQLTGYSDYTADAAFTSDGSRMVSLHQNGDIYVWDMAALKAVKTIETLVMGSIQIMLTPDDRSALIRMGGIPQRMAVIDLETGAITRLLGKRFESFLEFRSRYTQMPESGAIQFAGMGLSPDGTLLATSTFNDEVGLWQVADNAYRLIWERAKGQYGWLNNHF